MSSYQNVDNNPFEHLKFVEACEACSSELVVHGHRAKGRGKRQIIYCSCTNKGCRKYGRELGFMR
jgi:hypothetical protein